MEPPTWVSECPQLLPIRQPPSSTQSLFNKERQSAKDDSCPCSFRLSSEGLPLLLPYVNKQLLHATLADFQHLLQYRVIKFPDFVDADFGDKASKLMPGCCVVVLNEGNRSTDTILLDSSTIPIICWKGKTNLSIMVSQLDAKELLARLSARFGCKVDAFPTQDESAHVENDAIEDLGDAEPMDGSEAADLEAI